MEKPSRNACKINMTPTQPDMDDCSLTAESKDYLTVLPTELLVNVVEQLPVREICRLRLLSSHFRDFVDTNEVLLTQGHVNHHRSRIEAEYKLITDLSDCDIIDALRRYDSHYGLVADHRVTRSSFFKFELVPPTLSFNWTKSHGSPSAEQCLVAGKWMKLYSAMSNSNVSVTAAEEFSSVAVDLICHGNRAWSHGFTDAAACKAKFTQVTSARVHAASSAVPSHFITERRAAWDYDGQLSTRHGPSKHWEKFKLERLLGLPDLKSMEGLLAYCIRSKKTAGLVRKVKQGSSTRLKQAAIIEELFLW